MPAGNAEPGPVRRVCLFARTWHLGLGDLVWVNLFVQVLRQAYPQAEITHVMGEQATARLAEFFARHSSADRIVQCPDHADDDPAHWEEFFAGFRSAGYDCAVFDPLIQALVAKGVAECGVGLRIGFASGAPDQQYLTSAISIRPGQGCLDLLDFVQALARGLGVAAPAGEELAPWFRYAPQPVPVLPGPVVAVHPGGERHWNRRWPLARFGELCARLAAEEGASLVLLGPADEAGELAELAGMAGAPVRVCAGESLDTVASWLAAADVLVGNDSALAHIAAALHTPTVVLYGPTGGWCQWKRLYTGHRGVYGHAACEPIGGASPVDGRAPCAHSCHFAYVSAAGPYPRCLTGIETAEVHAAVREVLAGRVERSAGARR
jgi:ADP-heptose:LPS heptosyltransferase